MPNIWKSCWNRLAKSLSASTTMSLGKPKVIKNLLRTSCATDAAVGLCPKNETDAKDVMQSRYVNTLLLPC